IPTTPPTTPYVLDGKLYVSGTQVPGEWWSVQSGTAAWLAHRTDDTWWWGRDATPYEIQDLDGVPVISPNGRYVAAVDDATSMLTGFSTDAGGEGFGAARVDLGDPAVTGDPVHVTAVTDDGRVIAQGAAASVLWLPLVDNSTVDLTTGEPDPTVLGNTPAGLVVSDGDGGPQYLADVTDTGGLAGKDVLPGLDSFAVSPDGRWLAWTPAGSLGGEVTAVSSLDVQQLDGSGRAVLRPPSTWALKVGAWTWEDDDHLVSVVVHDDGSAGERLVRCSAEAARCVLIRSAT
ncbi:hypothetical protein ACFP8W_06805, partial [Nocardioides hankookensis]